MHTVQMARFMFLGFCALTMLIDMHQACAQESLLERYVLSHGGTPGGPSEGITAVLYDKYFGGGTAQASISFTTREKSSCMDVHVWRKVRRGTVVFALLVFRVEIRGFDAQGETIYSRDLDGFTFGDSSSGKWAASQEEMPAGVQQINISFVGNYE